MAASTAGAGVKSEAEREVIESDDRSESGGVSGSGRWGGGAAGGDCCDCCGGGCWYGRCCCGAAGGGGEWAGAWAAGALFSELRACVAEESGESAVSGARSCDDRA